jgi:hypothetical protein
LFWGGGGGGAAQVKLTGTDNKHSLARNQVGKE